MEILLHIIIILPLLSFLLIAFFSNKYGAYGSMVISCLNILLALFLSFLTAYSLSFDTILYTNAWTWVSVSNFNIGFVLRYDSLTAVMFLVVTIVSSCVHLYSTVYMYADPHLSRFMSYLSLFTFFMLLLVSAGNLLVLFLGWEGVGLCSYLLIGFWYTRVAAGKAATKAFLINKIGDLFLLSGISLTALAFHTLDFSQLSVVIPFYPNFVPEVIAMFILLGAVGKSAQIGLHTWLPDAMEGPTPVSALIHAATMVTAGVFLIVRCSFVFEYAPRILLLVAVWGGVTALISGTIGVAQNDIKKIIAYSTCSQLGYMVLACGLSCYNLSMFHLYNHAFFKACLFLCAGSVIHILSNEQDIRRMGGLAKLTPFTYIAITIASLALMGFPFLAGFYSKDAIIESANTKAWVSNQAIYWFAITSAVLTIVYSIRLVEQVFWNDFIGYKVPIANHTKITGVEVSTLGFLSLLSLLTGYLSKDAFCGLGSDYFNLAITALPTGWNFLQAEFLSSELKILPLVLTLLAVEIESRFLACKWFYNEAVNAYLSVPVLVTSRHIFEQYEKSLLEYNGPLALQSLVYKAAMPKAS